MERIRFLSIWKRHNYGMALMLLITSILYSCDDSKLAKEMEGTWTTSYISSYEDGTKSYIDEQVTFKNDNADKDGGSFYEIRTGKEELDEDEVNVKYRWISRIEGTWVINMEDLVLNYNISTLEVDVGKEDVNFDFKGKAYLWNNWGSLLMNGLYLNNNLYKELKKSCYKEMFRYYARVRNYTKDNGFSFSNVQIKGSILSYETDDLDRIEYSRVKDGQSFLYSKNDGVTEIENKEEDNIYSSSSNVENNDNNYDNSDYTFRMTGFVDKYKIYMFLNIEDDGKVSGCYYYDSQGSENSINLSGQYKETDETHQLILNCDNQDIFSGYIDDTKYSGEFTNSSNKCLNFNLRKIN